MASVGSIFFFYFYWFSSVLSAGNEIFTISRSHLSNPMDVFQVPVSQCNPGFCSSYKDATLYDYANCKCECKYETSTFGYHSSAWTCQKNGETRRKAGCTFVFKDETVTDPIEVVSERSSFKVALASIHCSMKYSSSKFLKCNSWKRLDTLVSSPGPFSQHFLVETIEGKKIYTIQVGDAKLLQGMLISLHFQCPRKSSCVLFKMDGDIDCPVNTTHQPITTQGTSTAVITSTDVTIQTSTSSVVYPETTQPIPTSSDLPVTSVTSAQPTKSPLPGKDSPHNNTKELSTGIIAAVAVVAVLVIIIVILFGYIIWKKKRGENIRFLDRLQSIARKARSSRSKRYKQDEPEESIYAEIPERPPNAVVVDRKTNEKPSKEMYSFAFGVPESAYAQPSEDDGSLYEEAGSVLRDHGRLSIHDDQDYVLPIDSNRPPLRKPPNEVQTEQDYNVLEDAKGQPNSTGMNSTPEGVDPRYAPRRERRRPPSPPARTNNKPSEPELGNVNPAGSYSDTYEELNGEGRPQSFYESLNHGTLSR